jgi:hypothetical protein
VGRPVALDLGVWRGDRPAVAHPRERVGVARAGRRQGSARVEEAAAATRGSRGGGHDGR